MSQPNIESRFRDSNVGWFRARTYHEHGVIKPAVRSLVSLHKADILDFGCGALPVAAASFALRYPEARVTGTDIEPIQHAATEAALQNFASMSVPQNLRLLQVAPSTLPEIGKFDLIYSWSVFEHIAASDIEKCFSLIRERMKDNGVFYFQIGGLYFSHNGHHLSNYSKLPWIHLRHSISELHDLVFSSQHEASKKEREWKQFIELNRLTTNAFIETAEKAGLKLVWQERLKAGGMPPNGLLDVYTEEVLITSEIRAIFSRA